MCLKMKLENIQGYKLKKKKEETTLSGISADNRNQGQSKSHTTPFIRLNFQPRFVRELAGFAQYLQPL